MGASTVPRRPQRLRGFVLSEWDLHNAVRIATKAAGDGQVINNLSIKEGGRR
jgi:osmotically-inducible protein OsmY